MADVATERTNIFGTLGIGAGVQPPAFSTTQDPGTPGYLIDQIKYSADVAINNVAGGVDWLAVAANAGQNIGSDSLVQKTYTEPDHITPASALANWSPLPMPNLPAFPTLPAFLTFDVAQLDSAVAAEITALQNSWMARYLPVTTDISRYDVLFNDILNGADQSSIQVKLDGLETQLQSTLDAVISSLTTTLNNGIAASQTALAANIAGLQPLINTALTVAADNATTIAWARARDQQAREAARQEAEAISEWASRGFSMPAGPLTAMQARARQATLDAASKVAADQAVKIQDMNLDIAKQSIDGWLRTADFTLRSQIESFRTYSETSMRSAALYMENDRAKVKQALDHLGLRLDFSKFAGDFALKYRATVMEAMNGLINAYAALARDKTAYLVAIAEAQRNNLIALIAYYKMGLEQAEIGINVSKFNNETDLKFANIAANFIGTAVGHHVLAAQSTADVYARIAAAAMSGLNGVASVTSSQ